MNIRYYTLKKIQDYQFLEQLYYLRSMTQSDLSVAQFYINQSIDAHNNYLKQRDLYINLLRIGNGI